MDPRARSLPDDQIDAKIFHRRVQHFFHRRLQAMNFVKKKYFLRFERSKNRRQISLALQQRPRAGLYRDQQFVGDNLRQRGLPQARRSIQQHVIERFTAAARRLDGNLNIFFYAFLPDVFVQPFGPHAGFNARVFIERLRGHDAFRCFSDHSFCGSVWHFRKSWRLGPCSGSALATQSAAIFQNWLIRIPYALHRPSFPPRARHIPGSPAPKLHRLPHPRADSPLVFLFPRLPRRVCLLIPRPCARRFFCLLPVFASTVPDRFRESPALIRPRSCRTKFSAPDSVPRRTRRAAFRKGVSRVRKRSHTTIACLRAREYESEVSLRCAVRRARQMSIAAPAPHIPRRPHPPIPGSVFFRRVFRATGQSCPQSIDDAFCSVNASMGYYAARGFCYTPLILTALQDARKKAMRARARA